MTVVQRTLTNIGVRLAQLASLEFVLFGADWAKPGTVFMRLALAIQLKR